MHSSTVTFDLNAEIRGAKSRQTRVSVDMISVQSRKQNMGTVTFKILNLFFSLFHTPQKSKSQAASAHSLIRSFRPFLARSYASPSASTSIPYYGTPMYVRTYASYFRGAFQFRHLRPRTPQYIYTYAPQTSYGWYHMVHSPRHHRLAPPNDAQFKNPHDLIDNMSDEGAGSQLPPNQQRMNGLDPCSCAHAVRIQYITYTENGPVGGMERCRPGPRLRRAGACLADEMS